MMRKVRYWLLLALWPFVYMWPYLMSYSLTPGNDFHTLYYRYKLYLVDLLAQGRPVPIWSPTEAAGFPFRANPFVGATYPLNHLLAAIYRLNGGYSEYDHVLFTIAAFSIFAIGMAVWLRALGEKPGGAILAALVFATSLKMTELMRFPNAAHAAAWIPWLLAGITLAFQKRRAIAAGLICLVSSYCLLTAGYPYIAYYTQFLAGPWILLLLIPATRRIVCLQSDDKRTSPIIALTTILAGCGLALGLCLSWLREMKRMLDATTDRQGDNWDYSTEHEWTVIDVLGSLVYPPRASMEGWYFFGIVALSMMALFVIASVWPSREQSSAEKVAISRSRQFIIILGVWWLFLTLLTLGDQSPLFAAMWKFYPGFSSLRVWGRMNVILLPIFGLLLSRSWSWWEHQTLTANRSTKIRYSACLAVIAVCVVALQLILSRYSQEEPYWLTQFLSPERPFGHVRPWLQWTVIPCGVVGAGLLLFLMMSSADKTSAGVSMASTDRWRRNRSVWLAIVVVPLFSAMETCGYGWLQWANQGSDIQIIREVVDIPSRLREGLEKPRNWGASSVSLGSRYQLGLMFNWYFDRYVQFLKRYAPHPDEVVSNTDQFKEVPGLMEMLGAEGGERFFFVPKLEFASPEEFVSTAREFRATHGSRRVIKEFDGDFLDLQVDSASDGYLCYIDNWDPSWRCHVNGREAPIEILMGTFKAVSIPAGASDVQFFCREDRMPVAARASNSVP
jgi:hypothetical protein